MIDPKLTGYYSLAAKSVQNLLVKYIARTAIDTGIDPEVITLLEQLLEAAVCPKY